MLCSRGRVKVIVHITVLLHRTVLYISFAIHRLFIKQWL
jgi:hypothetical protein